MMMFQCPMYLKLDMCRYLVMKALARDRLCTKKEMRVRRKQSSPCKFNLGRVSIGVASTLFD